MHTCEDSFSNIEELLQARNLERGLKAKEQENGVYQLPMEAIVDTLKLIN